MPVGPITGLQSEQFGQLEDLLDRSGLPSEDCAEQAGIFYGVFDGGELIAAGGLETAQQYSLLRSVVVNPDYRGRGLARAISEFLIDKAESEGRLAVFLLTETAANYFEKLGFDRLPRDQVPGAIARTRQFASLCPDSAVCMTMRLPRSSRRR